jgi:hypothetical protein
MLSMLVCWDLLVGNNLLAGMVRPEAWLGYGLASVRAFEAGSRLLSFFVAFLCALGFATDTLRKSVDIPARKARTSAETHAFKGEERGWLHI